MKQAITVILASWVTLATLHGQVVPAPAAPSTCRYPLQPDGSISPWLVLAYLPLGDQPQASNRLDSIGGEEKLDPFGGERVVIKPEGGGEERELTWAKMEIQDTEIPYYSISSKGLYLFVAEDGSYVERSIAYAFCGLQSEAEQNVVLRVRARGPVRIWLNGQFVSEHSNTMRDRPAIPLKLEKGSNRLLLRLVSNKTDDFVSVQLAGENGEIPDNVAVSLREARGCPWLKSRYPGQDWEAIKAEIPPVNPSPDEANFGVYLGRTMSLLESGGQTKRPVRILFYGQSITAQEWVWILVRRLRERYPNTPIEPENMAIGGWGINRLNRTIKHHILRARPDLVVLHAYQGGSWEWERIIQKIRRETSAEIMIRTAHLRRGDDVEPISEEDGETLMLRRLARKYGCELVEGRKEWLDYMRTHGWTGQQLRGDSIHLNRSGCVLMAQLYERHFRRHVIAQPWFDTVRRYEAMRPLADRRDDEVRLMGDGWDIRQVNCATSTGRNDRLTLTFSGNRVDLVMPPHRGRASVLIDGKPISEWNLYQGSRPWSSAGAPAQLMTYYTGSNMLAESWEMKITDVVDDGAKIGYKFRYSLTGSKTGFDGEGDSQTLFVSRSGRITINPDDFLHADKRPPKKKGGGVGEAPTVAEESFIRWNVWPLYPDDVSGIPLHPGEPSGNRYTVPYRYVTIADGLPPGEHELTLIPVQADGAIAPFQIDAVEIHRSPLRE